MKLLQGNMELKEDLFTCGFKWGDKGEPYYYEFFKKHNLIFNGRDGNDNWYPNIGDVILAKDGFNIVGIAKCISKRFTIANNSILSDELLERFSIEVRDVNFLLVDKWFDVKNFPQYTNPSGFNKIDKNNQSDLTREVYSYINFLKANSFW